MLVCHIQPCLEGIQIQLDDIFSLFPEDEPDGFLQAFIRHAQEWGCGAQDHYVG
jgi:hypothetical protein